MAKIFFKFDGELINAYQIEKIERFERYNEVSNNIDYGVIINRGLNSAVYSLYDKEFIYEDYDTREKHLRKIQEKLALIPNIVVI